MNVKKSEIKLINLEEFLSRGTESNVEINLYNDLEKCRPYIEDIRYTRLEDWSILANQIFGAEDIRTD